MECRESTRTGAHNVRRPRAGQPWQAVAPVGVWRGGRHGGGASLGRGQRVTGQISDDETNHAGPVLS